jgi:RHS repeat-associated protein
MDDLGLVHMNGRVYDPVLGRFISADPNVDGAEDAQGYNRYSYVGNNPLGATDPTGYFKLKDALKIVAIVVVAWVSGGAAIGWAMANGITSAVAIGAIGGASAGFFSSFAGSLLNGGSIGDAFKAGVIGGLVGAVSGGIAGKIGDIAQNHGWFSGIPQHLAHGLAQGGITEAMGGEFRHGFYAGFASSAGGNWIQNHVSGTELGTIAAAVVGGTASAVGGGKFANGAVSGAFTYIFNKVAHDSDYTILNPEEVKGKKIVGAYVTDEKHMRAPVIERISKNGKLFDRISPDKMHGKAIIEAVSATNAVLAVNGEAVELVQVASFKGYQNYINSVRDRALVLRYFGATFHGSGSKDTGFIHINSTGVWPKYRDDGLGFEQMTRAIRVQNRAPDIYYCNPADGDLVKNVAVQRMKDTFNVK